MMALKSLDDLLRVLDVADANLTKLRRNLKRMNDIENVRIDESQHEYTYKDCERNVYALWNALPKIDGWKPDIQFYDSTDIAIMRIEAQEIGFIEAVTGVENEIKSAQDTIEEYAYRLKQKRLGAARSRIRQLVAQIDTTISALRSKLDWENESFQEEFDPINEAVKQIDVLLGDLFPRPSRWGDLRRHLSFWKRCDVDDIVNFDWPEVRPVLIDKLYSDDEPIDSEVDSIEIDPLNLDQSPISTQLRWGNLTADEFERLIFNLINVAESYQDPLWLTATNAPDRGRDLSVYRVHQDPLAGTLRNRIIIQCKHWQSKSISINEVAALKEQMRLWEPPTVDVVTIATSGRFTTDAVDLIEKNNLLGQAPRIEMWPESHLEMLLSSKPALVAEFKLKE